MRFRRFRRFRFPVGNGSPCRPDGDVREAEQLIRERTERVLEAYRALLAAHPLAVARMGIGGRGVQAPMATNGIRTADLADPVFLIEPFRAWRAWEVVKHPHRGMLLRSLTYRVHWPPRRSFRAHCLREWSFPAMQQEVTEKHCAPDVGHRCGVYSVKNREGARAWGGGGGRVMVLGIVLVWGKVIEHEDGYLAEYAYPLAFEELGNAAAWESAGWEPEQVLPRLAERYGVANEVRP